MGSQENQRPALPETTRAAVEYLRGVLGGDSETSAYYDRDEQHVVAVVQASGTPHHQKTTFATASLHASPNFMDEQDIRVELFIVAPKHEVQAGAALSTAAFCVMKDRWLAAPGVVFPDVIREHFPDTTVPHIMWEEPFTFDGLHTVSIEGIEVEVHALQAVPIAESEWQFLAHNGYWEFTARLEEAQVLPYDFYRRPVC